MALINKYNSKKLFSAILILSVFSANITLFSLPVLAYEKGMDKKMGVNKGYEKINKPKRLKQDKKEKQSYVEGELLVKYKNNKINLQTSKGRASALNFIRAKSLEKKEDLKRINTSVLRIKDGKTVEQKVAELKNDPNVEYAQPNFQYYPLSIDTNDTYKNNLWGLDNTGQSVNAVSGTNDADIDAPEAWTINEGTNASIIVAVIDSGVAYNHPDLLNNMWDGSNCKDENGDVLSGCNHGYDYEDVDKTPLPTISSHGTHIAGTIAAVKNNGKGIIGVAPQAKIMALKSSLTTSNAVQSINFAAQNGAKVINASWGSYSTSGEHYDIAMYNAIKNFPGLFVVAAGNENFNHDDGVDAHKSYPDGFKIATPIGPGLNNIIVVAATGQNDALASFSDYGAISVDVGAPGENIYSTVADFTVLNETFEEVTPPATPDEWIKGGTSNNWGTYDFNDELFENVLYGDLNYPYANNADSIITSPLLNLSRTDSATISFYTQCDNSYNFNSEGSIFTDYMILEISNDGTNFVELLKWDELYLDILNGDPSDSTGGASYYFIEQIPDDYFTNNFRFRYRWITNAIDNKYDGCWIDFIDIIKEEDDGLDELYDYSDGTSMAAPHVTGLAALVWGYKPELSYAEVKNTILTTGDDLVSLIGKTVTGKRINAFNALNSLIPETHTISGTIKYYDGVKTVPNASVILEDGVGAQIATTTTDINGFYQFTDVAGGGNYVVRVEKSDNAAGLSSADQIKIGRYIVQLELFDTIYKTIAGDVNNSGGLTGADQGKIGRFIVGLDSNLPSGAWKFYSSDAVLTTVNYLTVGLTKVYTNLTTDMLNQNFIGIKMGDVNNSWINN